MKGFFAFCVTLFGLLLFAAAVTFALSNRQPVTVSLWPFGYEVEMPLYVLTLGALAFGLLTGGLFVWLHSLPHRFAARRHGKDAARLGARIVELETELAGHRARDAMLQPPAKQSFWKKPFWRN